MIRQLGHEQISTLTSNSGSKVDHRDIVAKAIGSCDYLTVDVQHKSLKKGGT